MRQLVHTRGRRRAGGFTMIEGLMVAGVLGLLLSTALGIVGTVARTGNRNDVETQMVGNARQGLDEILYQVRGASQPVSTLTTGGVKYDTTAGATTGSSIYVLAAPGYDPASPTVILTGVTDYVVLQYDKSLGKVYEVVVPGTGSKRPARPKTAKWPLLENVKSFSCTFKARDYAQATATSLSVTLRAKPISTPVVYVNGAVRSASVTVTTSSSTTTVAVAGLTSGDDVQVVYDVDPSTYDTATASLDDDLKPALEASVKVQLAAKDGRNIERVINLDGAARLRNRRG